MVIGSHGVSVVEGTECYCNFDTPRNDEIFNEVESKRWKKLRLQGLIHVVHNH